LKHEYDSQHGETFIRRAIELSAQAVQHGNHPFGALLVKDNRVILEAENTIFTAHDVTNHAEMNLVRLAVKQYDADFLAECALYTSTEPCAMCTGAIYWAGVGSVAFACSAERLAYFAGNELSISCRTIFSTGTHEILVIGPIHESEAELVHAAYWHKLFP
jgi:tRNA(Arg) A34 adenosine deaminase TadA